MAMKVSERGIAQILSHEAIVPMPYRDSVNVWTIGVGHTKAAGAPDPAKLGRGVAIPVAECIAIFRNDLPKYEKGVNAALKVPVEQHVFDALVSFHFNTGAIGRAGFVKLINAGKSPTSVEVCNAMMQWSKPPEIVGRRRAEMALMKTGKYPANPKIGIIQADAAGNVLWRTRKNVSYADVMADAEPVAPVAETVTPARTIPRDASDNKVRQAQELLKSKGYFPGNVDGYLGPETEKAIMDFRNRNGLPISKEIDDELMAALAAAEQKPVSLERATADVTTAAENSEPVKETVQQTWWSRLWAKVIAIPAAIGTAVGGIFDNFDGAKSYIDPIKSLLGSVPWWVYGAALAGIGFAIWQSQNKAEQATVEGYREGRVL
jgi:lysozyme